MSDEPSKYRGLKVRGRWRRMIRDGAQDKVRSIYPNAICMYMGKVEAGNRYVVFDPAMRIGSGMTGKHAWEDACRNVFADKLAG